MYWRWSTPSKSLQGRRISDAEDEFIALRSGRALRAVHVGGAGDYHQEDGSGTGPLCRVLFRMLHRGDFRAELVDVFGARLKTALPLCASLIATSLDRDLLVAGRFFLRAWTIPPVLDPGA